MSFPFSLENLPPSTSPWGPPKEIPSYLKFHNVPYAPFSKTDKLGKAADWISTDSNQQQTQQQNKTTRRDRDPFHAYGASAASKFAADDELANDTAGFEIVDSSTTANKPQQPQQQQNYRQRVLKSRYHKPVQNKQFQSNQNQGKRSNVSNSYRPYWNNNNEKNKPKKSSVEIKDNWKLLTSIDFNRLNKLKLDVDLKKSVVLTSKGASFNYNKNVFERTGINKKPIPLKPSSTVKTEYKSSTTSKDPILLQYAKENKSEVFITDTILSQIMSTLISNFSWDVVVTKKGNKLFFDKRLSSTNPITVDENDPGLSQASINIDAADINSDVNLSNEASYLNNLLLSLSIIPDASTLKKFELSTKEFVQSENSKNFIPKSYSYKIIKLPNLTNKSKKASSKLSSYYDSESEEDENDFIKVLVRTESSAVQRIGSDVSPIAIHAITQYKTGSSLDWNTKLQLQKGAILAAELRKNINQFSKWTIESILSDVKLIKIGFVSRANYKKNDSHNLLDVIGYTPQDLANQMKLNFGTGWGIFKSFIDIINGWNLSDGESGDGKFIIVKDPNSPKVSIYKLPDEEDALSI
ncbi:eukaryotic translation initiation factor 3 subunit D [Ascoidea rubescens DSM 1968]|uniref:Translation initiation factor eIF-3, subunit D n=1 Tax=Ascoidea rubescens DSM 1968 TaxID=1344418 RepID=A0A1D2VNR3_9ASCO|nr:translation initiation factor eIF-3, subunit D [Ascoidea rubescens DSM 1968]ODV63243.1 translation initiation factor eIF-3, subunit D [Ascoidea rubescens DSM 1968]